MPFAEDHSQFLDTDDFATSATYNGSTINGIFDDEYVEGLDMVESTGPQFLVRSSDVAGIAHGAELVINSVTYTVVGVKPDGTGMTTLELTHA